MPDTSSLASLYLVWATLLAAPPIALGAFILIGRRSPSAQSLTTLWSIVALILILGFSGFGFGFTTQLANYAFGCIAYFAYCILAASCLRIRIVYARLGGLIVTAVPILLGYFFGTIGFMALVWIIIPVSTPPKEMSKELICRITDWGSAVSDSGYDVQLYKIWYWAPFLQREVFFTSVNVSVGQRDVSCSEALAAYRKNQETVPE